MAAAQPATNVYSCVAMLHRHAVWNGQLILIGGLLGCSHTSLGDVWQLNVQPPEKPSPHVNWLTDFLIAALSLAVVVVVALVGRIVYKYYRRRTSLVSGREDLIASLLHADEPLRGPHLEEQEYVVVCPGCCGAACPSPHVTNSLVMGVYLSNVRHLVVLWFAPRSVLVHSLPDGNFSLRYLQPNGHLASDDSARASQSQREAPSGPARPPADPLAALAASAHAFHAKRRAQQQQQQQEHNNRGRGGESGAQPSVASGWRGGSATTNVARPSTSSAPSTGVTGSTRHGADRPAGEHILPARQTSASASLQRRRMHVRRQASMRLYHELLTSSHFVAADTNRDPVLAASSRMLVTQTAIPEHGDESDASTEDTASPMNLPEYTTLHDGAAVSASEYDTMLPSATPDSAPEYRLVQDSSFASQTGGNESVESISRLLGDGTAVPPSTGGGVTVDAEYGTVTHPVSGGHSHTGQADDRADHEYGVVHQDSFTPAQEVHAQTDAHAEYGLVHQDSFTPAPEQGGEQSAVHTSGSGAGSSSLASGASPFNATTPMVTAEAPQDGVVSPSGIPHTTGSNEIAAPSDFSPHRAQGESEYGLPDRQSVDPAGGTTEYGLVSHASFANSAASGGTNPSTNRDPLFVTQSSLTSIIDEEVSESDSASVTTHGGGSHVVADIGPSRPSQLSTPARRASALATGPVLRLAPRSASAKVRTTRRRVVVGDGAGSGSGAEVGRGESHLRKTHSMPGGGAGAGEMASQHHPSGVRGRRSSLLEAKKKIASKSLNIKVCAGSVVAVGATRLDVGVSPSTRHRSSGIVN